MHPFLQTILPPRHVVRVPNRFGVEIASETGPLDALRGQRVLVIADAQNLDHSSSDLGFRLSWSELGERLKEAAARTWLHTVLSRWPGDNRQWDYFTDKGWKPHAKNARWVKRASGQQRDANADNHLAFLAGHLCGRLPVDLVLIGTGDGELALDVAECVRCLPSSRPVATLSVAGATAQRLDARICDVVAANLEVGLDVLRPLAAEEKDARTLFKGF